jgi:hypothetical protein
MDDHVFLYEGQPRQQWRKSSNTALKMAGIKDFKCTIYDTFLGSWLAANGVPDNARMELMDNKTLEITARYTHLSDGYKRQAVATLPQFKPDILEAKTKSPEISPDEAKQTVVNFSR